MNTKRITLFILILVFLLTSLGFDITPIQR